MCASFVEENRQQSWLVCIIEGIILLEGSLGPLTSPSHIFTASFANNLLISKLYDVLKKSELFLQG
jgi:hypothetical protein